MLAFDAFKWWVMDAFVAYKWVMLAFDAFKWWVMLACDAFKWVMVAFVAYKRVMLAFDAFTGLMLAFSAVTVPITVWLLTTSTPLVFTKWTMSSPDDIVPSPPAPDGHTLKWPSHSKF
jgi:hypothetical protein